MITVSESIIIERPLSEVFAATADPFVQLKWDPKGLKSVEKVTPGPLEKGARFRGQIAGFGTVEYEFSEYEVDRRFEHRSFLPIGEGRHVFEFESVEDKTRITQTMYIKPKFLLGLLSPLMRRMMSKRLRQINMEVQEYFKSGAN